MTDAGPGAPPGGGDVDDEDGKIVDRIQQADMFGQMCRRFGPLALAVLIGLFLALFGAGLLVGALAL